jgi:hypothetical protein
MRKTEFSGPGEYFQRKSLMLCKDKNFASQALLHRSKNVLFEKARVLTALSRAKAFFAREQ